MQSLLIQDNKAFMQHLLVAGTFDAFELVSAQLATFCTFSVAGDYIPGFLPQEDALPAAEIPAQAGTRLFIVSEDEATSINEELRVKNEESAGAVFDLSGRKVANGKLPNGVYIINGRKVVIK